jgi:hypothetical protein
MHPIVAISEHHWLEYASWIANIILAVTALIAVIQVWTALKTANATLQQVQVSTDHLALAQKEIILRSKREALAMALDQCKRFAETIVPHFDNIQTILKPHGDYAPSGLVDANFPMIAPNLDPRGSVIWDDQPIRVQIIQALNELESFAMYFASDLADEEAAFPPTAQTMCSLCERYRFFIGAFRPIEGVKLYQNLVKLYGIWRPRLEHTALEEQVKLLDQKKRQLPRDQRGKPLGTTPL